MAMLFQPLRVFAPLALACWLLGVLKLVSDVVAMIDRDGGLSWSFLYQPVVSTSAVLLLLIGLQLVLMGMVADGVLRRVAQHQRPLPPSRAVRVVGPVVSSLVPRQPSGD
jgi:hypothetical protein